MTAFAAALLCSILMGGFALREMGNIDSAAGDVRDNWLPSVGLVGEINSAFNFYRVLEGAHITSTTEADMAAEERAMATVLKTFEDKNAAYEKLLTPGYETDLHRQFLAKWKNYYNLSQTKLLVKSRANQNEEASAIYRGESRKEYREGKEILEKIVKFNVESGKKSADLGTEAYHSGKIFVFFSIIIMVVVCLGATWMIVANVSSPIQAMTGVMARLARRELNAEVIGLERKDEIGEMARAVQVFKDGLIEADRLAAAQAAEQAAK
ncbi:MAG TPA: MCP four helix bundle domain-containing protein, partial [Azospirillaceae bacterium]|nr:MCP four helix bundle domain-containing protein [Azospirillaceae bacterium]